MGASAWSGPNTSTNHCTVFGLSGTGQVGRYQNSENFKWSTVVILHYYTIIRILFGHINHSSPGHGGDRQTDEERGGCANKRNMCPKVTVVSIRPSQRERGREGECSHRRGRGPSTCDIHFGPPPFLSSFGAAIVGYCIFFWPNLPIPTASMCGHDKWNLQIIWSLLFFHFGAPSPLLSSPLSPFSHHAWRWWWRAAGRHPVVCRGWLDWWQNLVMRNQVQVYFWQFLHRKPWC